MRQTGFFHHIGSFLLFVAMILLIITSISAPVVHNLSVLKVVLPNNNNEYTPDVTFGTFGYCIRQSTGDLCSRTHVGYDAGDVLEQQSPVDIDLSDYAAGTSNALTRVMVLHPVAAGMSFIAFLLALGAGVVGSFLASLVALLTFLVTLVVLITDFVGFSILKSAVNNSGSGATSEFGAAAWTLLASAVCNLLATVVIFFTCCSARLHNKRRASAKAERYDSPPVRSTSRRWF
ncbi:hypothetical protein JX265_004461 [Neoarthrinium moseri]|uniref:Pali-domain-containing protein n=1 Tax=Neoarthrinium moseri TaxID=1658444 RepID=A0A9P9WR11_9PEZI|nr:uncharacterized protein JN550_010829 [Neoarthrinium moseri]KAI1850749.1 hypothetical protein JX266_004031 [Neoarthrinium moseri]KAI1861449.1 hypothetical protein JN550_010829 [Neoarthrinium moseri]KAI1875403.1 hypothetical protein JX265_004461 [Neoarthrinium moseri]